MSSRMAVRNIRPIKDGAYQFTTRIYMGDVVWFDMPKWRMKPNGKLLPPAAKIFGKWVAYGDMNDALESMVTAAVQRVVAKVTEILARAEGLDSEAKLLVWLTKEEHVCDM